MGDVLAVLKFLEKHDTNRYNINSISTAKLGVLVAAAVAGKKSTGTVDDFLPFDTRKIRSETSVSAQSIATLQNLMRTRKLDPKFISMVADELKNASTRED